MEQEQSRGLQLALSARAEMKEILHLDLKIRRDAVAWLSASTLSSR
jgi:hypothetical protein